MVGLTQSAGLFHGSTALGQYGNTALGAFITRYSLLVPDATDGLDPFPFLLRNSSTDFRAERNPVGRRLIGESRSHAKRIALLKFAMDAGYRVRDYPG
jgi:hypothetical protein